MRIIESAAELAEAIDNLTLACMEFAINARTEEAADEWRRIANELSDLAADANDVAA